MASRRLRWGLYGPFLVLSLLAAGWCAFWFVARARGVDAIDDFFAREARSGRTWTCPERTIAGFPFRFELTCEKPTFAGPTIGGQIEAQVARVQAVWQIYDPSLAIAVVEGPLEARNIESADVIKAEWSSLRLSLENFFTESPKVSAEGKTIAVHYADSQLAATDTAQLHVRRNPSRDADDAFDALALVEGAAIPELDAALASNAPSRIELQATVSHAGTLIRGTRAERLERWRTAGGGVDVVLLSLRKGNQRLEGSGAFSLDAQRRPQGKIEGAAAGLNEVLLDEIVRRVGGQPALAGLLAGGLSMLANRQQRRMTERGPPVLPLPSLRVAEGRVHLGPIRLPVTVAPLY